MHGHRGTDRRRESIAHRGDAVLRDEAGARLDAVGLSARHAWGAVADDGHLARGRLVGKLLDQRVDVGEGRRVLRGQRRIARREVRRQDRRVVVAVERTGHKPAEAGAFIFNILAGELRMTDAEGVVAEEAFAALEERVRRGVAEDVELAEQALQELTGVGVHSEVTVHGRLPELLGVDVVHDHVGIAGPALEIVADLTDVEAGANAENQVCILYGEVARAVTAATRTTDIERVVARDDVRSVPADHDRDVKAMCDFQEERLGARDTDAVARIENRATARADLLEDGLHLLRIHRRHSRLTLRRVGIRRDPVRRCISLGRHDCRGRHRSSGVCRCRGAGSGVGDGCVVDCIGLIRRACEGVPAARISVRARGGVRRIGPAVAAGGVICRVEADQLVGLDELPLDVDRDVEPARTRAAGLAEIDALLERVADAVRVGQHLRILRHAVDGLRDIELLVAHRTKAGAVLLFCPARSVVIADLAGDDQHRDGVEPGTEHTGDGVGAARAGGHAEKRRPVVDAGVALGGHRAGLLVVLVERVHALLVAEGVVQVHGTATGHAEVLGDAVCDEGFGNVVRKLDFHYLLLLFVRSTAPRDVVYFIVLVREKRCKGTRKKTRVTPLPHTSKVTCGQCHSFMMKNSDQTHFNQLE